MQPLAIRLSTGKVVLADGAMGTLLQSWSLDEVPCLELLNLHNPALVGKVIEAYANAGAEIVQTNTFGASPLSLARWGLADRCEEINAAAARIARQVVGDQSWVVGSVGPCGRHLLPFGDLEPEELEVCCQRQITALIEAGVDAINIETIMDVEEGVIAVETVREISPKIPLFASITLTKINGQWRTPFGNTIEQAVSRFETAGASVAGANCSVGMKAIIEIAVKFREITALPLLMKPNAGLPVMKEGQTVWEETPEMFAEGAIRLGDLRVSVIGGCCGTTPQHIRALSRVLKT